MRLRTRIFGAAAALLGLFSVSIVAATPAAASSVEGSWKTQNGTEVTVAPCEQGYCGTLTWIIIPKENSAPCIKDKAAFGAMMLDTLNSDPALKGRPIVGMEMMTLQSTADPATFNAHLYNVEDGKSYDGIISIINNGNTMRLGAGCFGGFCAVTQDWPRVPVRNGPPDFICTPP